MRVTILTADGEHVDRTGVWHVTEYDGQIEAFDDSGKEVFGGGRIKEVNEEGEAQRISTTATNTLL